MKTVKTTILALLLVLSLLAPVQSEEPMTSQTAVDATDSDVVPGGQPQKAPVGTSTKRADKNTKKNRENSSSDAMTLKDIVAKVMQQNHAVLSQHLDYDISRDTVTGERSTFEPEFVNSYQRGVDRVRYSNEDKSSIFSVAQEKDEKTADVSASVEGKITTGANIKAGFTLREYQDRASDATEQYKSYLGVEITQPLLKGAGRTATAGIRVAEKDVTLSFQTLRQKRMETALHSLYACWDLYGALKKHEIRKASVLIAKTILEDNRERFRLGKTAETEILEAEAGLAKRQSQQARARQDVTHAMNQVKTFISMTDNNETLILDFSDHVNAPKISPNFGAIMNEALLNRPEYLAAKEKIDREDILVRYAQNQRWPQLDLMGSYGINGLGDYPTDSWSDQVNEDYHTWKVGATLTIPLMGGVKARSELSIARLHKRQAILAMKSVEVEIANRVDTAVKDVYSALEQVAFSIKARKVYQRLLSVEMVKLDAGRSNSRSVLDKEEDLNLARESEVDSYVYSKKAELSLDLACGRLLKRYDADITEGSLSP